MAQAMEPFSFIDALSYSGIVHYFTTDPIACRVAGKFPIRRLGTKKNVGFVRIRPAIQYIISHGVAYLIKQREDKRLPRLYLNDFYCTSLPLNIQQLKICNINGTKAGS